jgi:hypothetical protein
MLGAVPAKPKRPQAGASPPGVHPLPSVPVPVPPPGFVPPDPRSLLGSHPRQLEVATASEVVDELEGFTDYDAVFGATVPPVELIAKLLDFARQWRVQRDASAAWNVYVRAQDALAWKAALDLLDELKPAYKLAAARKPAIAAKYPRLSTFFDAHKQIAQRATATKTRKKAAAEADDGTPE